jgi:hypothetical protein
MRANPGPSGPGTAILDKTWKMPVIKLGIESVSTDDVLHNVCDPELPDAGELWDGVVARSGEDIGY